MALDFDHAGLSDALVILGAAGLVIPAFARFRISPVIGFILVGLAVGPSGLGAIVGDYPWLFHVTISNPTAIAPFAELGIVLLLFSIGLELSFKRLWSMRQMVFGVGVMELVGSALLIAVAMHLLGMSLISSIGLGLALSLSSTALVLSMVDTKTPVGQAAFAMLLFEDLALVPIIFLLGAMAPNASGDGIEQLATSLAYGGITIVAMLVAGKYMLPYIFAQAARTKSPDVFMAASLLVVIVASMLTALAGLSPIVGALLAGLLIAETDYHGEVEIMTEPFKGLALGVFLITVGMSLDIEVIFKSWPTLLAAVVGVIVIKTLVTALLLRIYGARPGVGTEVGVLMSSPSETTLIVLAAASAAQIISPQSAAFWQIVTALGLTLTPVLAHIGHIIARRIEWSASGTDEEWLISNATDEPRTVVIGFGRVGRMVCKLLSGNGQNYIAIESDPDVVTRGRRDNYPVIFGDMTRPEMLDRLKLGQASALILTMDDPVLSITITRRVRNWVDDIPIIVRARDAAHAAELYKAGASAAVPETLESSLQLAETALIELGVAMGPVIASIHQVREDMRQSIKDSAGLMAAPMLRHLRPDETD